MIANRRSDRLERSFDLWRAVVQGVYGAPAACERSHRFNLESRSNIDLKIATTKEARFGRRCERSKRMPVQTSRRSFVARLSRPVVAARHIVAGCYDRAGFGRRLRKDSPTARAGGSGKGARRSAGFLARASRRRDISHRGARSEDQRGRRPRFSTGRRNCRRDAADAALAKGERRALLGVPMTVKEPIRRCRPADNLGRTRSTRIERRRSTALGGCSG